MISGKFQIFFTTKSEILRGLRPSELIYELLLVYENNLSL